MTARFDLPDYIRACGIEKLHAHLHIDLVFVKLI